MFRREKKPAKPKAAASEPFTYIHHGTKIVGDLEANGRVRVHGTIHGNVRVGGVLEVAEAGVIEGAEVIADEVKILGRVKANVRAKGKIEIWKNGHLEGDVRASALDIEEGATFTGRSEMNAAPSTAATTPAKPAATLPDEFDAGRDDFDTDIGGRLESRAVRSAPAPAPAPSQVPTRPTTMSAGGPIAGQPRPAAGQASGGQAVGAERTAAEGDTTERAEREDNQPHTQPG